MEQQTKKIFGIVGSVGPLAGADLFWKFVKSTPGNECSNQSNLIIEQQLQREHVQLGEECNPNTHKLQVYETIQQLVLRKSDYILLSSFLSHIFFEEFASAINTPILDMMESIKNHVQVKLPKVRRIGILASPYIQNSMLFERYFDPGSYDLLYPEQQIQTNYLMEAIYGLKGLKTGRLSGEVVEKVGDVCNHLVERGADLIIPGFTEISTIVDLLNKDYQANVLDTNQIYVDWAKQNYVHSHVRKQYRIGIIGGLGPSATVDLMGKIIENTPAEKDQEHIKMVVEHNPQIPDRTAHLLRNGEDPTISLYNCAKKLESRNADFIVIPCNTAHAFIERIQRYLFIPILNMIEEVVTYIADNFPKAKSIGLLATTGTIETRIYHRAFEGTFFDLITPDATHQELVMEAIYGEKGVKAGFTDGEPKDKLLQAASFLVQKGAQVLILGCTELPLLMKEDEKYPISGKEVVVLDPTNVLAKKCVSIVLSTISKNKRNECIINKLKR